MSDFKWRHFAGDIILGCVRWYCKYGISYRELEEMMQERGLEVDHATIYRPGTSRNRLSHHCPQMRHHPRMAPRPLRPAEAGNRCYRIRHHHAYGRGAMKALHLRV